MQPQRESQPESKSSLEEEVKIHESTTYDKDILNGLKIVLVSEYGEPSIYIF
jgi:hypothetical protein